MPGIPLVARQTSCSRSSDQMCRQDSRVRLSAEEEVAAEESLSVYCKPVELYNILQRRAERNPAFLQRCLSYKIEASQKRRLQMTVSLSGTLSEVEAHSLFPLHILLARLVSDVRVPEHSAVYRFSRACILTKYAGAGGNTSTQACFTIPEISKLALEAKFGTVAILLVSCAGSQNSSGVDLTKSHLHTSSPSNVGLYCLLGKISLESLYSTWEKSPNLILGQRAEMKPAVSMHPCFLKLSGSNGDNCISFRTPNNSNVGAAQQVQVVISAEECGAKERSPYNSYSCSDIPSSSLNIVRLRAGNVVFNYRYYNNKLQRTEAINLISPLNVVTEDFSCPFCLVKCASFKGLKYHLPSSHDLFNFEFWVTEEYQAVNVSVKTDIVRSEVVADAVDPKLQTFFFCPKPRKRNRSKSHYQNANHVHPFALESDMLARVCELQPKTYDAHSSKVERAHIAGGNGVSSSLLQATVDPEYAQSVPESSLAHPTMLQFAKTRKLSIERSDPRNRALLQKRQFFHSHRAQPMAVEQVMSDRDSEDEVDDDVADFEDRRMLDDFVDVTKDEKQMMHMWNSFVRKQRVLADSHIPWACEAFSRLHGHDLIQSPALRWCWRLFMIKLWNHGLLDARTMNNCNIYLEQCQQQSQNQSTDNTIKS